MGRPFTYGSICTGAEACGPGWHHLGMVPGFHAETDYHASNLLRYHLPDVPNYGDFTTIQRAYAGAGHVDLLAGGTPCKHDSVAGLREGDDGIDGHLAHEFVELAHRLGAPRVLWKNVAGALSTDGGRRFGAFLGRLGQRGYGWAYRVLDAQYFGVPQKRRRVFLVGHLGDARPAGAVLFERESLRRDFAPRRSSQARLAGTLTAGTSRSGQRASVDDAANGLLVMQCHGSDVGDFGSLTVGSGSVSGGIPFTVSEPPRYGGSHQDVLHFPDGVMNSIVAGTHGNGGSYTKTFVGGRVRRLTEVECERLMGWPDDWTRWGRRPNGTTYELPAGARYRICGNGWVAPNATWIAERILRVHHHLSAAA